MKSIILGLACNLMWQFAYGQIPIVDTCPKVSSAVQYDVSLVRNQWNIADCLDDVSFGEKLLNLEKLLFQCLHMHLKARLREQDESTRFLLQCLKISYCLYSNREFSEYKFHIDQTSLYFQLTGIWYYLASVPFPFEKDLKCTALYLSSLSHDEVKVDIFGEHNMLAFRYKINELRFKFHCFTFSTGSKVVNFGRMFFNPDKSSFIHIYPKPGKRLFEGKDNRYYFEGSARAYDLIFSWFFQI